MQTVRQKVPLLVIAKLFLKLGIISIGGLAVYIILMQKEVVRKGLDN